jgi:hypothetical protein
MEFKYDRFNKEELLQAYKKASICKDVIIIPGYDFEISLYDDSIDMSTEVWKTYDFLIKEILTKIPEFDNSFQHDCEKSYRKSNSHLRNFTFSLQIIYIITQDEVILDYWADEVNSTFQIKYRKFDGDWIKSEDKKLARNI